MRLHRLTDSGMQRMGEFIDSLTSGAPLPFPNDLIPAGEMTQLVESEAEISRQSFATRMEAAEYLEGILSDAGIPDVDRDKGLWSWLSLYYFDLLRPPERRGRRKPHDRARWIPAISDYRKYYRHLLAGPYRIYHAHRDNPARALALLCGPLNKHSEIAEQLASYQEIVTNRAIVEIATRLYVDPDTQKPKLGAGGKGPGSPRRLARVMGQFDLTWDLYAMCAEDLIDMLPPEFNRFLPH